MTHHSVQIIHPLPPHHDARYQNLCRTKSPTKRFCLRVTSDDDGLLVGLKVIPQSKGTAQKPHGIQDIYGYFVKHLLKGNVMVDQRAAKVIVCQPKVAIGVVLPTKCFHMS